jgi:hypothetical protein
MVLTQWRGGRDPEFEPQPHHQSVYRSCPKTAPGLGHVPPGIGSGTVGGQLPAQLELLAVPFSTIAQVVDSPMRIVVSSQLRSDPRVASKESAWAQILIKASWTTSSARP